MELMKGRDSQKTETRGRWLGRLLAECNKKGYASGADLANRVRQYKKGEEPVLKYGVDGRGKLSMKVVGGGGVRRRRQKEGGFVSGLVDVLLNDG